MRPEIGHVNKPLDDCDEALSIFEILFKMQNQFNSGPDILSNLSDSITAG
jgi:hypothetical protein